MHASGALYGTRAPAVDALAYCGGAKTGCGMESSGCSGAASSTRRSGAELLRCSPPACCCSQPPCSETPPSDRGNTRTQCAHRACHTCNW